nr:DUF4150 domain-containing protein [Mesorhizobium loti]
MPTHITVNGLGLTHKSSTGFSKATIPDVCKTPTPGGPVPMPYPNFAMSSTLGDGTTTVFAKGGQMIAIKGSQYKMSTGDEPGTVGGVKSNTFKQATDWITYSFDVKMDGKNACRDTDKKFHNNKNTVDLMGNANPAPGANPRETLLDIMCECHRNNPPTHPQESCEEIGIRKHECCDAAVKNLPQPSGVDGERGYDKDYNRITDSTGAPMTRDAAKAAGVLSGSHWPDACSVDANNNVTQFFDFKFVCPRGHPYSMPGNRIGRASGDPAVAFLKFRARRGKRKSQFTCYKAVGKKQNPKVKKDPQVISSGECK